MPASHLPKLQAPRDCEATEASAGDQPYVPDHSPEAFAFFVELHAQGPLPFVPHHAKVLDDGSYVLAKPLLFHWTVIRGWLDDLNFYFDRWCYETKEMALKAVADYPAAAPANYEPGGWHRHPSTGRRRPDGDPAREFVDR